MRIAVFVALLAALLSLSTTADARRVAKGKCIGVDASGQNVVLYGKCRMRKPQQPETLKYGLHRGAGDVGAFLGGVLGGVAAVTHPWGPGYYHPRPHYNPWWGPHHPGNGWGPPHHDRGWR